MKSKISKSSKIFCEFPYHHLLKHILSFFPIFRFLFIEQLHSMVSFYGSDVHFTTNCTWKFVNSRLQLAFTSYYCTLKMLILRDFDLKIKTLIHAGESLYHDVI